MTITGTTRVAAVIGDPVEHSASPALHNAAFSHLGVDAVYVALRVVPEDLPAAVAGFAAQRLLGVSVTVPHKQAIVPLCDELAESARSAGAVNCLELSDSGIVGHNTDGAGFVDALERGGISPDGCSAVLLGAGGAARAVAAGLEAAGAAVTVVARSPAKVTWRAAQPWSALDDLLGAAQLLIDCTPTALSETTDVLPDSIALDALGDQAAVMSLVYHREPALLAAARARGLRAIDGAGMLVHQAARAFQIWTGKKAPAAAMWRALRPGDTA